MSIEIVDNMPPKKKRKNPGKGASFEREICKKLSLWISKGEHDNLLWRSITSGAHATLRRRNYKDTTNEQFGDIVSTNPASRFLSDSSCIECKFYSKIDVWDLAKKNTVSPNIYKFWANILDESNYCGKIPILIIKSNYKPTMFVIDYRLFNKCYTNSFKPIRPLFKFYDKVGDIYVFKFDDIILNTDAELFKDDLECVYNDICSYTTLCNP